MTLGLYLQQLNDIPLDRSSEIGQFLTTHLTVSHRTLVCHGTDVENHVFWTCNYVCVHICTNLKPSACIRPGCRSSAHTLRWAGTWWWWPTGSWRPAGRSLPNTAPHWSEEHKHKTLSFFTESRHNNIEWHKVNEGVTKSNCGEYSVNLFFTFKDDSQDFCSKCSH